MWYGYRPVMAGDSWPWTYVETNQLSLYNWWCLGTVIGKGRIRGVRVRWGEVCWGLDGWYYSKTVLGCKENRRYEMGVQKMGFFETPIEYRQFSGNLTLFCYYHTPYFTHKSRFNADLSSRAKWAVSDGSHRHFDFVLKGLPWLVHKHRAKASFRLPIMAGEEELGNFAMNARDCLEKGVEFEQEIGPQIAINREQLSRDYIDPKKNLETVKKTKREVAAFQKWLQGQQENMNPHPSTRSLQV